MRIVEFVETLDHRAGPERVGEIDATGRRVVGGQLLNENTTRPRCALDVMDGDQLYG